jgi:hypothetical protein
VGQSRIEQDQSEVNDEGYETVLNERLSEISPLEQYDVLNDVICKERRSFLLTAKVADEGLSAFAVKDPWKLQSFKVYSLVLNGLTPLPVKEILIISFVLEPPLFILFFFLV